MSSARRRPKSDRTAAEAGERASAIDVELATLAAEAKELNRRIEEAAAEPAEGDDPEELRVKLERLERRGESPWAASTRSRKRSTSARRSGSPSYATSAPISKRA